MKCSVCGGKAGLTASRTKNGDWFCSKCFKKAGGLKTWMKVSQMPLGAIVEKVNGSVESMSGNVSQNSVQPQVTNTNIIPTKVIGNNLMLIDEKNQKVQFPKMSTKDALRNYIGVASGNTAIYSIFRILLDMRCLKIIIQLPREALEEHWLEVWLLVKQELYLEAY